MLLGAKWQTQPRRRNGGGSILVDCVHTTVFFYSGQSNVTASESSKLHVKSDDSPLPPEQHRSRCVVISARLLLTPASPSSLTTYEGPTCIRTSTFGGSPAHPIRPTIIKPHLPSFHPILPVAARSRPSLPLRLLHPPHTAVLAFN